MSRFDIEFGRIRTHVQIGAGILETSGGLLAPILSGRRVMLVTDTTVEPLYAERVATSLGEAGFDVTSHSIAPGEGSKSLQQAQSIYDRLAEGRFARDAAVLALGGGVVSDLAGFVAGTWMRGVDFVICPTTLEADVDASVGGKTAVNHPAGKNLIGVFHQPRMVLIDPSCLQSLSQRDVVAGLGESVKHGAIADPDFLGWHRDHRADILAGEPAVMEQLIERNVRIKADVVARDEREQSGLRAALNFGHTIGHALEAWSAFELRHGEAVALGMVAACRLSVELGLLDAAGEGEVVETLEKLGLPVSVQTPPPARDILEFISRDKKVAGDRVRFVLLDGLGRTVLRDDVPQSAIRAALAALASR